MTENVRREEDSVLKDNGEDHTEAQEAETSKEVKDQNHKKSDDLYAAVANLMRLLPPVSQNFKTSQFGAESSSTGTRGTSSWG
jgi:gamma-glutamyl phosphate reductase